MKRILALCCALSLLMMGASAGNAEQMSDELTRVTLKVKEAVDISDEYDSFSSDKQDGSWYLTWNSANGNINVVCDSDGKIYSYYRYEYEDKVPYIESGSFTPAFPDVTQDQLEESANEFMQRVVTQGEGWEFNELSAMGLDGGSGSYTISGRITRNGFPTDIYIDITLSMNDMTVTGFYRGDSYMRYTERLSPSDISISEEEAKKLLMAKKQLQLQYYIVGSDDIAQLMYVPCYNGTYIVRASDGEIIDLDKIYNDVYAMESVAGNADYSADQVQGIKLHELTEAEKQGISVYEGALSVDELDAKVREIVELGINGQFKLTSANYYNGENELTAELSYSRELSDEEIMDRFGYDKDSVEDMKEDGASWTDVKNISIDAYTGKLLRMNTYRPTGQYSKSVQVDKSQYQSIAEDFIAKYMDDIMGELKLSEDSGEAWKTDVTTVYYDYCRVHDGYIFEDNYVNISICAEDGTIDSIERNWNFEQEFETVDEADIISAENALEVYLSSLKFEAAYISIPVASNDDISYDMTLCWHYMDDGSAYGVDAVTGELFSYEQGAAEAAIYDDIAGIPQEEMILKLAEYSVGFEGDSFMPDKEFTVRDMLTIMLTMGGYSGLDEWDFEALASSAANIGAGNFADDDPERQVTRTEFARALISAAGYSKASQLSGIYVCEFEDASEIPENDIGVVAIAHALGIIAPDDNNMINSQEPLTRAQAAEIAYNFLSVKK